MPGRVSASSAQGAPTISPDADFGIVVVGASTSSPVAAGHLTNPYNGAQAAVGDLGLGDAVDCLTQAIVVTPDNPAPQGVSFYRTPATTPGARGVLNTSGVTGSCVVTETASQHPVGTYQPVIRVVQGGTIGTPGIILQTSLGVGGPALPPYQLGSATTYAPSININGSPVALGISYDLAAGTLATGDVWNESKTTPPMWGDADLYTAGPPAAGAFAAIAASANSYGLIILTEPFGAGDFSTAAAGLNYLETFNKRPALLCRFRDPYGAAATTIASGSNNQTNPQATIHVVSTTGFASSGSITIGADAIAYTGVTSTTFTGCTGGTGTMTTGEAVTQAAETDAQHVQAYQAFALACRDARITCVFGNGWLTDAYRAIVYFRNGLPSLVARLQGNVARPGRLGEKLAKSPAYVGDGPLPDFTLKDTNGNPITQAHDEMVAGGIDGPLGDGGGGGIAFYFNPSQGVAGTYISEAPCLYPSGSTVLTLMDTRVTSGIMRELVAAAWTEIQGSEIVNGGILDQDAADAISHKLRTAILAKFANEFANADDPNLVVVDPAVTVSGANVSMTVAVNDELFDYANDIAITLYNIR